MSIPSAFGDVFHAISSPTRRAILDALSHGELSVSEIARPFAMTAPAVSQQLRILRDTGLVSDRREGRERIYRLNPFPLRTVTQWVLACERTARDAMVPRPDPLALYVGEARWR